MRRETEPCLLQFCFRKLIARAVGNVWLWFGTWWPYAAVAVGALFVLLACASATSRTTRWASWRSCGRRAARCREGQIIALDGEAGYQAELLRGGMHFGYWRWQYRVHKVRLVTISQGKIGYVYARDGEPLPPSQTLGQRVECNNFQDARAFLVGTTLEDDGAVRRGQRGRQRAILREGVYAINPALFVVITEDHVFALPAIQSRQELKTIEQYRDRAGRRSAASIRS